MEAILELPRILFTLPAPDLLLLDWNLYGSPPRNLPATSKGVPTPEHCLAQHGCARRNLSQRCRKRRLYCCGTKF